MLTLALLQRTICILFILSLVGDCAVIPDVGLEHANKKAASDHKRDTITRIKSREGPKDRSSRDHLVNKLAKMAFYSSKSWPSVADEKDERLKVEARAKAVRELLKSGREIEIVRSTNPPSVKSTAGHVGYEERHRFSGVRFDELLDPNEPNVDYKQNSSGGTFDLQDSDDEDEDSGSENERESDSDLDSEVVGDAFQNNNGIYRFDSEPEEETGLSNVIADDSDESEQGYASQSRQSLQAVQDGTHQFDPFDSDEDSEDEHNIHWETSSKSKVSDLEGMDKPRSKLTWSPSSESKIAPKTEVPNPQVPVTEEPVAKAPATEDLFVESPITELPAYSIIHWEASSQSKAMGVKPVEQKASEIHWKISSQSKADAGSNTGKR